MKPLLSALLCLALAGCLGEAAAPPQYALVGNEKGVFQSRNAGSPIALERIRGMSEQEVLATFGAPMLDRKDDPARVLRYQSDACTLFVSMYRTGSTDWQARFADAYDTHLRPLPIDQCAGSVAAQKRRVG